MMRFGGPGPSFTSYPMAQDCQGVPPEVLQDLQQALEPHSVILLNTYSVVIWKIYPHIECGHQDIKYTKYSKGGHR